MEPLADAGELEQLWRALDRTGTHSFFVSWPWIGALVRSGGTKFNVVKARRAGEIVGLALLGMQQHWFRHLVPVRQLVLNASGKPEIDSVMIEHNGFAVPSGDGSEISAAFVHWFSGKEAGADELVLPGIRCRTAGLSDLLLEEHRRPGFRTPLQTLGAEGLAGILSRNGRQQLRRSLRDYGERLALDRAENTGQALAYFEQLKLLHIKSWSRRGRLHAFQAPHFEQFHRMVISAGVDEGTVDILRVTANGRVLGFLYNFVRNGVVANYQSGFADEVPGERPGYVCHALAISHYASRGMQAYDFLAGSNRLKESFGVETYELCWQNYRRRTPVFLIEDWARRALLRLRPG